MHCISCSTTGHSIMKEDIWDTNQQFHYLNEITQILFLDICQKYKHTMLYIFRCVEGAYICRPSKFQVTYRVGNDKGNISRNIWAQCEFGSYQTPLQQQPDILPNISLPTSLNHRYWVWKRGTEAAKKGKNAKKCRKEIFRLEFFLETYFVWTWEFLGTSVDTILEK